MKNVVLIVEDERYIATVLHETLKDEGFTAEVVSDGTAALRRLQQEPVPAVVVLDLFLPGVRGRDVVASMRRDPKLLGVPVVLVTGAVETEGDFPPAGTYQAVIFKPFDLGSVVATVQRLAGSTA